MINYRKGGVPFINLVTVIPIPWDTEEIVFHVGFQVSFESNVSASERMRNEELTRSFLFFLLQVDLVESPNAILRNIRDGTYQVNYASLNVSLAILSLRVLCRRRIELVADFPLFSAFFALQNPQLPLAPAGQIEYAAAIGNKAKGGLTAELLDVLGSRVNEIVGEEALQTEWYKTIFDQSDGEFFALFCYL